LHDKQAIIDLADEFFSYDDNTRGELLTNYQQNLDQLSKKDLAGFENKILAFYIADEPSDYGITRDSLDIVIRAVKKKFPNIPTYIIWDQDCFDNTSALDDKCGLAGQRGIPADVDWVGFDWYIRGNPAQDNTTFKNSVVSTMTRMKRVTNKPIVMVPDGTDEFLKDYAASARDTYMTQRLQIYFNYALSDARVIGVDNYAWADHTETFGDSGDINVLGTREYPKAKKSLFDFANSVH